MIRLFIAIVASAAIQLALPARADTGRTSPVVRTTPRTAMDGSTICVRTTAAQGCADYQARLLRTVGQAAAASKTDISVNDLGRRQLDALIASVN